MEQRTEEPQGYPKTFEGEFEGHAVGTWFMPEPEKPQAQVEDEVKGDDQED